MKDVENFLLKNGFEKIHRKIPSYKNNKCTIMIVMDKFYSIRYIKGKVYSDDLNIYWLIGFLTYNGLMDKNYIQ